MHGHVNPWIYSYGYFKTCCKVVEEAKKAEYKMMVAGMAGAIGLAFSSDKKAIDNFLKEK
jgi:hypothetical protein